MQNSERLRGTLEALVNKLDEIAANPEHQSVCFVAQLHRGNYTGPTWEAELKAAKAALADTLTPTDPYDSFEEKSVKSIAAYQRSKAAPTEPFDPHAEAEKLCRYYKLSEHAIESIAKWFERAIAVGRKAVQPAGLSEREVALEEAAVAMCSYCQGKTFRPREIRLRVFTVAQDGYDSTLYWHGDDSTGAQCQASSIRALLRSQGQPAEPKEQK